MHIHIYIYSVRVCLYITHTAQRHLLFLHLSTHPNDKECMLIGLCYFCWLDVWYIPRHSHHATFGKLRYEALRGKQHHAHNHDPNSTTVTGDWMWLDTSRYVTLIFLPKQSQVVEHCDLLLGPLTAPGSENQRIDVFPDIQSTQGITVTLNEHWTWKLMMKLFLVFLFLVFLDLLYPYGIDWSFSICLTYSSGEVQWRSLVNMYVANTCCQQSKAQLCHLSWSSILTNYCIGVRASQVLAQ